VRSDLLIAIIIGYPLVQHSASVPPMMISYKRRRDGTINRHICLLLILCTDIWICQSSQFVVYAESAPTYSAESAMKTMKDFTSKRRQQSQPNLPNLLSESALMDKETNAIYWQGGASTLSHSITNPYLTQKGIKHVKATILSAALWLWIWGHISRYLVTKYFTPTSNQSNSHKLLFSLPFISTDDISTLHPILRSIISFITPIIQFFLLIFHSLLYLRLPQYSPKVLATTIILYLLEAWNCSTRRYLSNGMNAPTEVEAYLEKMRSVEPSVKWKVRCFHYEDRELWKSISGFGKIMGSWIDKKGEVDGGDDTTIDNTKQAFTQSSSETFAESPPFWMSKKVVTHQAVSTYKFANWEDHTLASLWKRSQSFSSNSQEAPFSKLSLSKLLLLKDRRTRQDYFAQQSAFVMLEGRKDVHAEFATTIEVDGFRPKLLAVRPVRLGAHKVSAALFRQHIYILSTLLGLSLPFRIWFAKHCDEIRVTVVKETCNTHSGTTNGGEVVTAEPKSSWFRSWGKSATPQPSTATFDSKKAQELFRTSMQQFSLYNEEEPSPMVKKNQTSVIVEETVAATPTNLVNAEVQQDTSSDLKVEPTLLSEKSVVVKMEEEEDAKVNETLASEDVASSGSSNSTPEKTDTAEPADSLPVISMLPKNPPSISESSTSDNKETDS